MNETAVEQILTNLVHNSVEAGATRVIVRTDSSMDRVCLTVQDNGSGMSPEQLTCLFDPFYTTRRNQGGTGLGLSIVHGIVHDHGGDIQVASEPGEGSTFTVSIPLASPAEKKDDNVDQASEN